MEGVSRKVPVTRFFEIITWLSVRRINVRKLAFTSSAKNQYKSRREEWEDDGRYKKYS